MKKKIKKLLIQFLGRNIFFQLINLFLKNKVIILMYHDVNDDPNSFYKNNNLNVYKKNFANQIKLIKEEYNILKPKFTNLKKNKVNILITFDDGCKSYLKNALPILTKNLAYSINFLNFDVIDKRIMWPMFLNELMEKKKLPKKEYFKMNNISFLTKKFKKYINLKKYNKYFLNKNDLKKMEKNKYCFFGSHLFHHLNCVSISKKYLIRMIDLNNNKLKKYKNYIKYFSYPYGQQKLNYSNETDKIILSRGFQKIFYADFVNVNKTNQKFGRINMTNEILNKNHLRGTIIFTLILNNLKFWR